MNEGQLLTVPCAVIEGDAPISLQWLHNNEPIAPHHRVSVVQIGDRSMILSITSVNADHIGEYSCVAKNDAGLHKISDSLNVNGTFLFCTIFEAFVLQSIMFRYFFYITKVSFFSRIDIFLNFQPFFF